MTPKLYIMEGSPAARAVLMLGHTIGLNFDIITLDYFKQEHLKPDFLKINPQHSTPTLVDDDGTVVWDSHAIMIYLVEKNSKKNPALYPSNLHKKAVVNQRLHYDNGNVYPIVLGCFAALESGAKEIPDILKELSNKVYATVNTLLGDNEWIAGNDLTIADFSLISSITGANLFVPINAEYKNLTRWIKRCEKMPFYYATLQALKELEWFVKEKLSK